MTQTDWDQMPSAVQPRVDRSERFGTEDFFHFNPHSIAWRVRLRATSLDARAWVSQRAHQVRCVHEVRLRAEALVWTQLSQRYAGIPLHNIHDVILETLGQCTLLIGGMGLAGGFAGGVLGGLAGGIGAVPGALSGAATGAELGLWYLNILGLAAIAEYLTDQLPRALALLRTGLELAWTAGADENRDPIKAQRELAEASQAYAEGYIIVIEALLSGLLSAVLAKGAARLLQHIAESSAGFKLILWVEANQAKLRERARPRDREDLQRVPADSEASAALANPPQGTHAPLVLKRVGDEAPKKKYKTKAMDPFFRGEHLPGNEQWDWLEGGPGVVKYLGAEQRRERLLTIKGGRLYDATGKLFDTKDSVSALTGEGRAIFVMDREGNFFASREQILGEFHHSSFFAGAPVAAAGELEVSKGVLQTMSDRSGHYKPPREFTRQAIRELQDRGVDMSSVMVEQTAP